MNISLTCDKGHQKRHYFISPLYTDNYTVLPKNQHHENRLSNSAGRYERTEMGTFPNLIRNWSGR